MVKVVDKDAEIIRVKCCLEEKKFFRDFVREFDKMLIVRKQERRLVQ